MNLESSFPTNMVLCSEMKKKKASKALFAKPVGDIIEGLSCSFYTLYVWATEYEAPADISFS